MKERKEPSGIFYYWNGERPRDPSAPQLDGTGEIRLESVDRASGHFTTRAANDPGVNARTAGGFWRADPGDLSVMDGPDDRQRAEHHDGEADGHHREQQASHAAWLRRFPR